MYDEWFGLKNYFIFLSEIFKDRGIKCRWLIYDYDV